MTSSPILYTVLKMQNVPTFPRVLLMLYRSVEQEELRKGLQRDEAFFHTALWVNNTVLQTRLLLECEGQALKAAFPLGNACSEQEQTTHWLRYVWERVSLAELGKAQDWQGGVHGKC